MSMRRDGRTPAGKQRWVCREGSRERKMCYSTTDPTASYRDQSGTPRRADKNPQFRRKLAGVKRFVITAAQNATPIHDGFFASLRNYCEVNEAELIVIPIRYKNVTSQWTQSQENAEVWDPALKPYLYNQRKKLNENLVLIGDIKTHPTATKPLSGFESITGAASGIFGHTKIQMNVIPTPQGRYPKILTTTGAVTVKNYTDSKAGAKGAFHHALAALVVDIVGKKFFIRHVNAMRDGSFIDLNWEYSDSGVVEADPALAIVFGDTHRAVMDKKVEKATFSKGGMVDTLDPEYLIFHDIHDALSSNPHERDNPFRQVELRVADLHIVQKEIEDDVKWLTKAVGKRKGVVVASNHDNFLSRWLRYQDWRRSPSNAEFYLETALHMVREIKAGNDEPCPYIFWVDRLKGDAPIRCLKRDESFALGGVELSLHGDMGPNGARGSRENLRRIGVKTIIGHSHSPGIEEGCYQAGTSTLLRLNYNKGPSSWLHAHVILYSNGKRAILPIIDGEWCFDAS